MKTNRKYAIATLSLSLLTASGWLVPQNAHANASCEESADAAPQPAAAPAQAPETPKRSIAGDERWMPFNNRNSR